MGPLEGCCPIHFRAHFPFSGNMRFGEHKGELQMGFSPGAIAPISHKRTTEREELLDRPRSNGPPSVPASRRNRLVIPPAILGVPFDPVTIDETIATIDRMIASRQPHQAVTANVDFLVQSLTDVELRRILIEADLVLCDGTPLVWVSRLLGNALPERVAGADVVPELIRHAADKNYRLFFLGGRPEVGAKAIETLHTKYPGLAFAEHYSPPFAPLLKMDHREIRRRIHKAKPDILFVSFGCPKAEKWIAMNYRSLGVPVCIGVGATIDFLAGEMKRAPVWMQQVGLEWVFRLLQEPARLGPRYATDLRRFGWAVGRQWLAQGRNGRNGTGGLKFSLDFDRLEITAGDHLNMEVLVEDLSACALPRQHCLIDLSAVTHVDCSAIGWLLRLHKSLEAAGRRLILLRPSDAVHRALKSVLLDGYFCVARDSSEVDHLIKNSVNSCRKISRDNAGQLFKKLCKECDEVLNLHDVEFMDSTGATMLARLQKRIERKGRTLRLAHADCAVRNVLHHAGLEQLLKSP